MSDALDRKLGLYVHWPFCAAKCPYCDFNSHVTGSVDVARWERAFSSELSRMAEETEGARLTSIFFGGGTPSLMPPWLVERILTQTRALWRWANDIEITLEANPTSIEREKFQDLRLAGVNRVSLGVQALNDQDLRRLGRLHSADEARQALGIAQATFDRVSIDLIYARQEQTAEGWQAELAAALSFGLDHMSLYQLTIEPNTVFAKQASAGRLCGLPDEDLAIDLWDMTQALCENAGLPAYETSNHARPGQEAQHNLTYWTGGDWAAVGPGAHGRLGQGSGRIAFEHAKMPTAWLERVETRGNGESQRQALSLEEVLEERLLMGLRLSSGIEVAALLDLGWVPPKTALAELDDLGLVAFTDRLKVTAKGRPLLDAIIRQLVA